ncbi:flavin reductase family protein [Sphingobacterium bovistauri]|uniref:Iron-sulfur cluster-binding domain-containing protein n=1 Tax=Sphingobacterium bovistauri TaxID=2781959 RepID=A0ABS7Z4C2_9SPHI|nr:iron-sulfur cluster-binding domain-containing protein [Sphingobacterium bovistauri]MCA5004863.1 iron-sulfur cluster-binding domain-containing protein [Sphingobacterium bovistauri]
MYDFRVSELIRQPNDIISIRFEDLSGKFPTYKAGQFLTLNFQFGEREVRRSYSFSSSPSINEPLEITVKRVENGEISRLLHHKLAVNDVIQVLEPQGLFFYEPDYHSERTIFLFAAGVGITPLFSILKTALTEEIDTKVVLIYSNSSKEKTAFYEELLNWQQRYPNRLTLEFIWSDSKNLAKARLNREYLIVLVNQYLKSSSTQASFYTCGPLFYMDLVRFTLLGMGFADENIRRETFHFPEEEGYDDEQEEAEVDNSIYNVLVKFNGQDYRLSVPANETILNVGLSQKIKLPYSCKSGMCSTCIAQVTKGAVKMDYNEVLTDNEVEIGKCLICVSHPVEDNTIIEVL